MSAIYRTANAEAEVRARYVDVLNLWPVPNRRRRLPTRQGETFVLECGDAAAPPVVLLHGSQSNAASWMFDASVWSRWFRVFAVDLIGEARLSAPARPTLDSEAHAAWLDEVLDGLELRRAAFVGVSLGGFLALDYARRRPTRVERLALICPAGIGRQKNFLLRSAPLLLLGACGARRMREAVFGKPPAVLPPAVRPLADLMALIGRSVRPRMVRIPTLSDEDIRALDMPLFVVVGGRDVLIDSAGTRDRLTRLAPSAKVAFLPEGRHFLPGQTEAIMAFLEAPSAAQAAMRTGRDS